MAKNREIIKNGKEGLKSLSGNLRDSEEKRDEYWETINRYVIEDSETLKRMKAHSVASYKQELQDDAIKGYKEDLITMGVGICALLLYLFSSLTSRCPKHPGFGLLVRYSVHAKNSK